MSPPLHRRTPPVRGRFSRAGKGVAVLPLVALGACTANAKPASTTANDPRSLSVTATDTACTLSGNSAPSGKLRFSVINAGSKVTEFYLLAPDGQRIVGEVENIGPGLTRELVVTAAPGRYVTACKPGMVSNGIRAAFSVSD